MGGKRRKERFEGEDLGWEEVNVVVEEERLSGGGGSGDEREEFWI